MADPNAAEMNALAGERSGDGGGAVEEWRRKIAETLDGPADRAGAVRGGAAGGYGTLGQRSFPPPAPTDNIPVPEWDGEEAVARMEASRIMSSEGDDEWATVRKEYAIKPGPLGWAKRLPAHVLIMMTVVGVVAAVVCAVIFMTPASARAAAAKSGTQALAGKHAVTKKAVVATTATAKAAVPPLTGAQKKEVETLANQQAQQMASAAMAAAQQAQAIKQEQQLAAQRQAQEQAKDAKKAQLAQLLTARPNDSPEVRVQIHRAVRQQRTLAFDKQRVQVAENNLMPLQNNVNNQQAGYDAENQQYLSWEQKMQEDENQLQGVEAGKQQISQRLAQLKVLGRRESSNMPQLKMQIIEAERKEALDLQASQRFGTLATDAAAQLHQTSRAEADDTSAVSQEQGFVHTQQAAARNEMQQANTIVASTSTVEERIAQLTPVVGNLRATYLQDKRQRIQSGLVIQDERRQKARNKLNSFIRQRERLEQLPSTPARTKQIQDISKQLLAAQKHLGSLYSDEETDRVNLEDRVKGEEHKSGLYLRWKAKNAALVKAKARLSHLSTSADQIRMQAQTAVNSAQDAQNKASRTQTTNSLLLNSERRLRIKEKVFTKEAKLKAANAKKWAAKENLLRSRISGAKAQLSQETMQGEEYLENALSGQQQRKQIEGRVQQERQAFQQEAMLRRSDKEQLSQAETQLDAAEAVVHSLQRQQNLAKALAWKSNMQVKQARQQQQLEEQVVVSQYYPQAAQKWNGVLSQAAATANTAIPASSPGMNEVVSQAAQASSAVPQQAPDTASQIQSERMAKALAVPIPGIATSPASLGGVGGVNTRIPSAFGITASSSAGGGQAGVNAATAPTPTGGSSSTAPLGGRGRHAGAP
mmetsp:Transcript_63751/g.103076  ORF Transcript_63751/g.103076 Transcript_63751/m.103076 type:complete len:874 (+) Transcript_63751:129-2750(+)